MTLAGPLLRAGPANDGSRRSWKAYHRARRTARRELYPWVALALACFIVLGLAWEYLEPDVVLTGRKLLAGGSCSKHDKWEEDGGVVVYFIGVIYLFLGIAIICDDFFVNALEAISEALKLSEDVAGATFMAAGSSAPELFSSLMSLINPSAGESIGIGTIVGSAVFNILVIIGVTAICAGRILNLDWRPMLRDGLFYSFAIISVILAFVDQTVHWWEGIAFSLCYVVYIVFMKYNVNVMEFLDRTFPKSAEKRIQRDAEAEREELELAAQASLTQQAPGSGNKVAPESLNGSLQAPSDAPVAPAPVAEGLDDQVNGANGLKDVEAANSMIKAVPPGEPDKPVGEAATAAEPVALEDEEDDDEPFWIPPGMARDWPLWLLSLPWHAFFYFTVPNCKKPGWEAWYMVTFAMSIVWIGIISWFMVEWAADIGCILKIPEAIMGVTVLAAGTSIPDALSSVVVARQGMGDMAVANAVGSNVFDIWLGLGLPWAFVLGIRAGIDGNDPDRELNFSDSGALMLTNVIILFGVLACYLGIVMALGWRLTPQVGYVFLTSYLFYVIYYVVFVWNLDIFDQE